MTSKPEHSPAYLYRYHLLLVLYASITSIAFLRVARQPYSRRLKTEQYETIFKATTLDSVAVCIAMTGGWNKPRSEIWK
ncbi:uncharacterized protein BDZ99DRAFT_459268 [Mytilinidion resinicola]|uniref:Uncharacterized protein n=1 Tax=Mytilinidion resinicola TaxID=574789 RepID=A0A6A6Z412_9PEZI|nr:uncharacterized protein BDZ99DRAFT_459268 [Mytilinidion resinicola]KAF2815383.1 hypothetical protein BDZ99DRAFT_459268 [Mytilinidion resinicola]